MTLETISEVKSHGGVQGVYRHASSATGTDMTFAVFMPPQPERGEPLPVLWYLSRPYLHPRQCHRERRISRRLRRAWLIFVAPGHVSPRGDGVPDDPEGAWDFGLGAGFYVDATEAPWSANYRMWSYVTEELPALVAAAFSGRPWRGRGSPAIRWAAMAR